MVLEMYCSVKKEQIFQSFDYVMGRIIRNVMEEGRSKEEKNARKNYTKNFIQSE